MMQGVSVGGGRVLIPSNHPDSRKDRFYKPENQILSQASEHAEIVKHFSSVFTRHAPAPADFRRGSAAQPALIPPKLCKLCSADLMPHIQGMIRRYFAPGELLLPDSWTDSWLCLLPKPNKPAKIPQNLRSIALQCPLGKCVARILKQKLQDKYLTCFDELPQYAGCH